MPICFYYIRPTNIEYILDNNQIKENNSEKDENTSQTMSLTGGNKIALIECPICLDDKKNEDFIIINCGHQFCVTCIEDYLFGGKNSFICAYCRCDIKKITLKNRYYYYKFKVNTILFKFITDELVIVYRVKVLLFLSFLLITTGLWMVFSV